MIGGETTEVGESEETMIATTEGAMTEMTGGETIDSQTGVETIEDAMTVEMIGEAATTDGVTTAIQTDAATTATQTAIANLANPKTKSPRPRPLLQPVKP
jgi:hypothetical protein